MSGKNEPTVSEADRKQAIVMIEEKLSMRDKLLEECIMLADEFGVMFTTASTAGTPSDTYLSRKYLERVNNGELLDDEDEEYGDEGWQRGWQSSYC